MRFTLRKTLKRLKSLENYFKLKYADDGYGYMEHIRDADDKWGILGEMETLKKNFDELKKTVDKLIESDSK